MTKAAQRRAQTPAPTARLLKPAPLLTGRWREEALCSQVDPELFFSEHGSPTIANRICHACPVQALCLDDALARNEIYGVWGGLTTGERAAERRRRRTNERANPVAA